MRTEFWSEKGYCKIGKEKGEDVKIIHRMAANILQRHDFGSAVLKIQVLLPFNQYLINTLNHCDYVPPDLTFNNSTFCPHSVIMCFVWI
jgi:hypothetical protein